MNDDHEDSRWPESAGDVGDLPTEMSPPADLEDRVTAELLDRGLIAAGPRRERSRGLAAAAALLLLLAGFVAGRWTRDEALGGPGPPTQPAPAKYALLLYETEGFRPAARSELLTRYREYGEWVAEARARGQFVTGEDFRVDEGRILSPTELGPKVAAGVAPVEAAPLSGVFVVTARDFPHAVELASSLPHLVHGGEVVIQQIVPTEQPPSADAPAG